ncbi:response regulator [Ramlibacter humi]|uniref:Response regulator transcription factor n=1 Tax=Ramlibacter humi TaxID=2530451 RepID=A0A4Z0CC48_9BURK|nr:response regulator transcription factor [Ramlibacter humi]TFZ07765.1 response regulator transcription factor [Ramlibacter humi]
MPASPLILLLDDHTLFRSGLRMVLAAGIERLQVLEAASLDQALALDGTPQLLLVDVQLPGLNGLEAIAPLRRRWPRAAVVMLSSHTEPEKVKLALERGAAAYVSKADSAERILAVVVPLLRGESLAAEAGTPAALVAGLQAEPAATPPRLTPRQCEVLNLMCQGLSNKVIGRRMSLSENTVRGHVQAILAALQVSSRSEAAFVARRLGLIA